MATHVRARARDLCQSGNPKLYRALRKCSKRSKRNDQFSFSITRPTSKSYLMDRVGDVMRLCCDVSANHQIKAAVTGSTKGAVVAGGGALIGALLLGPPGIAVGGALGGLMGWRMTSGQFKPVPQILMELPPQQQRKLYNDVMAIVGNLNWMDAVQLVTLVMGNASLQQQVVAAILSFVTKELQAEIRYGD